MINEAHLRENNVEDFAAPYRHLFPVTRRYVYLNHASVSPLSTSVCGAMRKVLDGVSEHADRKFGEWEQEISLARAAAARLVNAQPREIAFLRNTSEAISVIANGMDWRAGDNIVSPAGEFPANVYPWARLKDRSVELRLQPEGDGLVDSDELLSLVDERTRIVAVSWVQFGTGQRLDIRRIGRFCRERNILFVVDAIQGLGALHLDVERDYVDAFAAGGHKFLMGPKGAGLLYVSERVLQKVAPSVIGWTAVRDYDDYLTHDLDFREGAVRFEGGTLNEVGICGLGQALELFLRVGPEKIEQHLLSLNQHLTTNVEERGYRVLTTGKLEDRSSIIVFEGDGFSADDTCQRLASLGIIVSTRLGRLRVAPHFYNSCADIDRLVEALPQI
ncbi:MAG: aminotransferase class V-fold PLP-dependent enzyme [Terriglobales bacterium]